MLYGEVSLRGVPRHFVGVEEFTKETLTEFLYDAREIEFALAKQRPGNMDHLATALAFPKPLTRLFFLFEKTSVRTSETCCSAAKRMGAEVRMPGYEPVYSSFIKDHGSVEETVLTLAELGYNAFMVRLENVEQCTVKSIADTCDNEGYDVHIFCAGERGVRQPIQTLCDRYTVFRAFDGQCLDGGMTYVMVGDMRSPTLRDFLWLIALHGAQEVILVSEDDIDPVLHKHLADNHIRVTRTDDLLSTVGRGDLYYFTQYYPRSYPDVDGKDILPEQSIQWQYAERFGVTEEFLVRLAERPRTRVIHPKPVWLEFRLVRGLRNHPQFHHHRPMIHYGLVTTMALLLKTVNPEFPILRGTS